MNHISIGTQPITLPKQGFLFINDEVPLLPSWKRPRYFDPRQHAFNPLEDLDYRKASDIVDIFDALFDRGNSTLTKDTGLDFIAERLETKPASLADLIPEPDKKSTTGQIWAYGKVRRLMRSPVLKSVLCQPTNFSFNPRSAILARVNRAELGEWDSTALGLFLMAHFKGQLCIPDFGFYGRDTHSTLIRENRLIAGVRFLDELPEKLRRRVLTIEDKTVAGALYDDAVMLAKHEGLIPDTIEFNDYVAAAMEQPEPIEPVELWTPPSIPDKPARAGGIEKPAQRKRTWARAKRGTFTRPAVDDTDLY